ncbi:carboxypeptidase-like regulatory domain-containing protein [Mucilaginibacter dorajii]|uniref:TonB-dependent receptor n=1 Tax=Mucilaginibacter dorajii TaxID=692994 RepID=A0ABP7RBW1_9SPHI|nr:carboxypeptidase-like regulatory domain-containing protein [Mucilaginibacter dorajii]MCS3736680.1 hypothetical protein [Mucilaginibacter dorajii]
MKYAITLVLFIICQQVKAQVTGNLKNAGGQPVPFAKVILFDTVDSVLLKSTLTDDKGAFRLEPVGPGRYTVKISAIGYQSCTSPIFEIRGSQSFKSLGIIELKISSKQLNEVVIRADKPLVQQEAGGMVVNVQNSLLTKGSSALQVLQRSPGVIINPQNTNITLNGKAGW